MNGTNGHNRGRVIDESVEADRDYAASSSPMHAVVAGKRRDLDLAEQAAADSRRIADERWSEFEQIKTRLAEERESTAQRAATKAGGLLETVLRRISGKTPTTEDLDTLHRTCEVFEGTAIKDSILVVDATEALRDAEQDLQHDTWERFRAVTSRRFEAMRCLIDSCGPAGTPGGDLLPLITPHGDGWVSWTQQNVYIGGSDREDALAQLNAILAEDTHAT